MNKTTVTDISDKDISKAKRYSEWLNDWFERCCNDMICFLASQNTKPEWKNENYCGEEQPYKFVEK